MNPRRRRRLRAQKKVGPQFVYVHVRTNNWGVFCVQDRAYCTICTRLEAERDLPRWKDGTASDVDPDDFDYELRRQYVYELTGRRPSLKEAQGTWKGWS